ncbi:MAG TPA: hypothetical protein VGJ73_07915, partial [Verrucomicrobiae bacterium]
MTPKVVGTARCAVRAASSGAKSVVGRFIANVPPGGSATCDSRAVTPQRSVPTHPSYLPFIAALLLLSSSPALTAQPAPVTNVVQVSQFSSQNPDVAWPIHLEGTVLWANSTEGQFVLQDSSGAEELQMNLNGLSPRPGQQIRLDGNATITKRMAG